jgi:hypothetical protein
MHVVRVLELGVGAFIVLEPAVSGTVLESLACLGSRTLCLAGIDSNIAEGL